MILGRRAMEAALRFLKSSGSENQWILDGVLGQGWPEAKKGKHYKTKPKRANFDDRLKYEKAVAKWKEGKLAHDQKRRDSLQMRPSKLYRKMIRSGRLA